jgi:hypothetical protein
MTNRIIKDIRFYESESPTLYPQELGKIFIPTNDTKYIGQRIARKLNELQYNYEEFDHIYINFTTCLNENEMAISERNIDKRIKYLDFGINPKKLNSLSEEEKNRFVVKTTFKLLKHICNAETLNLVHRAENLISEFGASTEILYKSKETKKFKIDIYYQIGKANSGTKAKIIFKDKISNTCSAYEYQLQFYEDIYFLVDSISLNETVIIFEPQKSAIAELSNKRYNTPIKLNLSDFKILTATNTG